MKGSGTYVTGRFSRNVNIGVILPSLMGDVYPQFISGIEDYATANHINVVLLSSESIPEKQKRNVYQLIEMGADGCIIIPIINSEMSFETLDILNTKKIPFVLCNRSIDGLNSPFVLSLIHISMQRPSTVMPLIKDTSSSAMRSLKSITRREAVKFMRMRSSFPTEQNVTAEISRRSSD